MSFIDVAIPAIIGLALLIWPQVFNRDPGKLRLMRGIGAVLLVVAAIYLAVKLMGG